MFDSHNLRDGASGAKKEGGEMKISENALNLYFIKLEAEAP